MGENIIESKEYVNEAIQILTPIKDQIGNPEEIIQKCLNFEQYNLNVYLEEQIQKGILSLDIAQEIKQIIKKIQDEEDRKDAELIFGF